MNQTRIRDVDCTLWTCIPVISKAISFRTTILGHRDTTTQTARRQYCKVRGKRPPPHSQLRGKIGGGCLPQFFLKYCGRQPPHHHTLKFPVRTMPMQRFMRAVTCGCFSPYQVCSTEAGSQVSLSLHHIMHANNAHARLEAGGCLPLYTCICVGTFLQKGGGGHLPQSGHLLHTLWYVYVLYSLHADSSTCMQAIVLFVSFCS